MKVLMGSPKFIFKWRVASCITNLELGKSQGFWILYANFGFMNILVVFDTTVLAKITEGMRRVNITEDSKTESGALRQLKVDQRRSNQQ